jgi:hypothetical protein
MDGKVFFALVICYSFNMFMNSATGFRAIKTFSFVIDALAEEARVFVFCIYLQTSKTINQGRLQPSLLTWQGYQFTGICF